MAKPQPPLEAKEEADFLKEIKKRQLPVKTRKMNGLGFRDWPDRLVVGPKKFTRWIEFKRKELGKLSAGQAALFAELGEWEHPVAVFDDGKMAAAWLEAELLGHLGES